MMGSMRRLISFAVLAATAASPAVAQHPSTVLEDLRMQQEAAQRRAVDQSNQLMALEARLRADQASADLSRSPPRVPELRYEPSTRRGTVAATARYPSISDAALADSNRRVQDAARNRR